MSVYLNLGSNRGNRAELLARAVSSIRELYGAQAIIRTSPVVETPAWGYDGKPFLNMGVALDFHKPADQPAPLKLLDTLQEIERRAAPDNLHRNLDGTYRDRFLDIDIIHIDGVVMETPRLTLPHPRAALRDFVLKPMHFLCPGWQPAAAGSRKKTAADMHRDSVEQFRGKEKLPLCIVLDNVRSENNIGSVFRTADAFCLNSVILCGISATPPSPAIHKTALGAEDSVAWKHFDNTMDAVDFLKDNGWTVCCLEQVHDSIPLDSFYIEPGWKIAIIAGNEISGVDPAVVDAANLCLEIPQAGTKHSLNVAVSSAIALWHCFALLRK